MYQLQARSRELFAQPFHGWDHRRFTLGNTVALIAVIARRLHFDPTKKTRSCLATPPFARSVVGRRLDETDFHPTSGVAQCSCVQRRSYRQHAILPISQTTARYVWSNYV